MMRKPSCLISCSHWLPEGSLSVLVGRHGAMNPAGRVRVRNIMPTVRDYSRASQSFCLRVSCLRMIARLTLWDTIGAFLTRSQPKAPGAALGLSFTGRRFVRRVGRLDDPLTRTVVAATEQKYPVLLEYAKASFERIKQRLRHLRVLARVKRVLNDCTLVSDLDHEFGDMPVGLRNNPLRNQQ